MERKFEWDDKTKVLTETKTGDELVDAQQKRVDGRYHNVTIYPHATAIDMIKELERQLHEADVQEQAKLKRVEKANKDLKPVDQSFYLKFKACIAKDQIAHMEEPLAANKAMREDLIETIKELKGVMGIE